MCRDRGVDWDKDRSPAMKQGTVHAVDQEHLKLSGVGMKW